MPEKKPKTMADLRAAHDRTVIVPNRIREALAALKASGDVWTYEADFQALMKPPIANGDISRYRDGFADFWAELPSTGGKIRAKRVWFATKAAADQWKETVSG
jgi:hypothetical protein